MMADPLITQDALDRLERNLEKHIEALKTLMIQRFTDHERRLEETNNAHALAVIEKQKTDAAAVKIQENAVTKTEWHQWKDDINRRLDVALGIATANATTRATMITVVGIIVAVLLKFWKP